jgi:hypothetical protein
VATIFISYSRRDMTFIDRLAAALAMARRDYWLDRNDIPPSAEWSKEIEENIENADAFLFVISPDSITSAACQSEVAHALRY